MKLLSDIEIAREATPKPITEVALTLGVDEKDLIMYGKDKAKFSWDWINKNQDKKNGNLVLVTAITPTPAGEGKTTTTVGLGDALNKIGKKTTICLREPSLGPCFGMKGGAAGGGRAQVIPMEDINLHFTGDFHAITSAHNLLAAMIDNHIHWGNASKLDIRKIQWRRVLDLNDRSLRDIAIGLGGTANGFPRQTGFDITVASEIMAVLCLSKNMDHLQTMLGQMTVGYRKDMSPVFARDLEATGAMSVLLQNALAPNLVQTLENNPALIHGGPFANIAHGCNSVIATNSALKVSDYVITEAGFGADLGAEKFFHIKCKKTGLAPKVVVVVATIRALKMHGGLSKTELTQENVSAVAKGFCNLKRHLENLKKFGIPTLVAINHFYTDKDAEVEKLQELCTQESINAYLCKHWEIGGAGAEELARAVVQTVEQKTASLQFLYEDQTPLVDKINVVAKEIYRAKEVRFSKLAKKQIARIEKEDWHSLPICMAKTQYSFSVDPTAVGAPSGHILEVQQIQSNTGAGFHVVVCGDIMRMPGLPKIPAANKIGFGDNKEIVGLF